MRRALLAALAVSLAVGAPAIAKFGISKTKVRLARTRPPDVQLLGETVSVEVKTSSRRISERQVDAVGSRIKQALGSEKDIRLVETGQRADNAVVVSLEDLEARVSDRTEYETKYVKIGERQEWDAKKNKYVTKDVYGNRQEPVRVTIARGNISARIEVETPMGPRNTSARAGYDREFKNSAPAEASSEEALERYLVDAVADEAAATLTHSPDPVEAMLAVDGELKNGNRLAEAGVFDQAIAEWNRRILKGDKEAARLHNIGVAHEALAYAQPLTSPEHRAALDQASNHYKKALALDPGEKYFSEPNERIQVSLGYAEAEQRHAADRQRFLEEAVARRDAEAARARQAAAEPPPPPPPPEPPRRERAPRRATPPPTPAPKPSPKEAASSLGASASLSLPLRNGSFESSLGPWTLSGQGGVVEHPGRGKVLQASGGAGSSAVAQPISVDVTSGEAGLSLDYKVTAGEAAIKVLLGYDDAQGRARVATLEVTAGDAPGNWTPWRSDVSGLRPKASRLREVRVLVEGGTALLDNVALTLR